MEFKNEIIKLLCNKDIKEYINSTYIKLSDIKKIPTHSEVECYKRIAENFIKKIKLKGYECKCLIGMSGSGKSTLSKIANEQGKKVISTDEMVNELKCFNPNLLAKEVSLDEAKMFEYSVVLCMFISKCYKNYIFDFGGGTALQIGLIELVKAAHKVKIINLEIDDKTRIANIVTDCMYYGDASVKTPIKTSISKDIRVCKVNVCNLVLEFASFCNQKTTITTSIEKIKVFIEEKSSLKSIVSIFLEHAQNYDENSRWRLKNYEKIAKGTDFKKSAKLLGINL